MIVAIVNSKGYWQNGWLPDINTMEHFSSTLEEFGIEVQSFEVENVLELRSLLSGLEPDTLILPNAYHVNPVSNGRKSEPLWLCDVVEEYSFGTIGPGSACLKRLLQKHVCQRILKENGVPVPDFCFVDYNDTEDAKAILEREGMTYPAIVKPTGESSGVGISKDSVVNDLEEAVERVREMHLRYHQGVVVETYLPGPEFTGARFEAKGEGLHLVAEYQFSGVDVVGEAERTIPWGENKRMVKCEDRELQKEIEEIIDKVWKVLGIQDLFRLDGKLDAQGRFRVFDVNGFPALSYRKSATPVLCAACFPDIPEHSVYQSLVSTILLCAAEREGVKVPPGSLGHNFFALRENSHLLASIV